MFPGAGIKVLEVYPGAAARQGLRPGDIILSFNGIPTPTFATLRSAIHGAGSDAEMVYLNADTGEQEVVTVTPENGTIGIGGDEVSLADAPAGGEQSDAPDNGERGAGASRTPHGMAAKICRASDA